MVSHRFVTPNKKKIARDKIAKHRQMKDMLGFDDDFLRMNLDNPNICLDEQTVRYSRHLKPHTWTEPCTKNYETLAESTQNPERVEPAQRRGTLSEVDMHRPAIFVKTQNQCGWELVVLSWNSLYKWQRSLYAKGLCSRCRQKRHSAKNCPKARRNWLESLKYFQARMNHSRPPPSLFWSLSICSCFKLVKRSRRYPSYFK